MNLNAKQTMVFKNRPKIESFASVVGPKEGEGPLASWFDVILDDDELKEDSYEKAESSMLIKVVELCLEKARIQSDVVGLLFGGDLLNQIIATSFAARKLNIPFLGLYGACSTMAESIALGAAFIDGGLQDRVICSASSHFSTAERQFRMPLELGNQRTPTAQWTVTAAGATLLSRHTGQVEITHATVGRVVDYEIYDAANMGAAMAPAAADTISCHFRETGRTEKDYDLIITGDLAKIGKALLLELLRESYPNLEEEKFMDCGCEMFDDTQDVHAGASGCGCVASVLNGYIMKRLISGNLKRVMIVATGALMSPTSSFQGESIPGIAHAIVLERVSGG